MNNTFRELFVAVGIYCLLSMGFQLNAADYLSDALTAAREDPWFKGKQFQDNIPSWCQKIWTETRSQIWLQAMDFHISTLLKDHEATSVLCYEVFKVGESGSQLSVCCVAKLRDGKFIVFRQLPLSNLSGCVWQRSQWESIALLREFDEILDLITKLPNQRPLNNEDVGAGYLRAKYLRFHIRSAAAERDGFMGNAARYDSPDVDHLDVILKKLLDLAKYSDVDEKIRWDLKMRN